MENISSIGYENFDYNDHEFFSDSGKEKAQILNIKQITALVIDDKVLINPEAKDVKESIESIFDPKIIPTKQNIVIPEKTKDIIYKLSNILPAVS